MWNRGACYFSLAAFCWGNETYRQVSVSMDEAFAALLTFAPLHRHCAASCAVGKGSTWNSPSWAVVCAVKATAFGESCLVFSDCNYSHGLHSLPPDLLLVDVHLLCTPTILILIMGYGSLLLSAKGPPGKLWICVMNYCSCCLVFKKSR